MTFITYDETTMNKVRVIEKLIDGRLLLQEAVEILNCSERSIYRYKKAFHKQGPPGLVHGLKGKPSNHQGESSKYGYIRGIFRKYPKYYGFGPTLMSEHLEEDFGIIINKETLRQIMIKEEIWKVKPRKKKIIRQKRERRAVYGAMIQFDGSYHDRLENGENPCLLCAVDDATGKVYAKFSKGESFDEVFEFWKEYFDLFGKPQILYVDCHATYKVNHPQDQRDKERKTRFARGMDKLGVFVIYSKEPQGKGRVEKGNQTHQDRLVKKMRLLDIKTINDANSYLKEKYLNQHNSKFSVPAREAGDGHVTYTPKDREELERYFAKEEIRTVKNDGTVKYKNNYYQLKKGLILKSKCIIVKESIYGNVRIYDGTDCLRGMEN